MTEIPEIGIKDININIQEIPVFNFHLLQSIPQNPPVTLSIGSPIIQLPGCVEYNPANEKSNELVNDDSKGNRVLCDGTVPSYDPIDYTPEQLIYTKEAPVPTVPVGTDEVFESPTPEIPTTPTPEIICPPNEAPIVGSKVEGNKKISGYEIQDGRCITLYEEIPIIQQVVDALPTAGAVTTTTSIAVVATTSAVLAKPLADLALKAIKPLIKTAMKKIQMLLGKTPIRPSYSEMIADRYREKKGLPPLKKKKGK
tara:strand:- start:1400 stop:2164 length:765 start_codon:yes stop_codon:yes gene_type:complete